MKEDGAIRVIGPLTETDGNHRETCIDRMHFDKNSFIKPVKMTVEGVKKVKKRK